MRNDERALRGRQTTGLQRYDDGWGLRESQITERQQEGEREKGRGGSQSRNHLIGKDIWFRWCSLITRFSFPRSPPPWHPTSYIVRTVEQNQRNCPFIWCLSDLFNLVIWWKCFIYDFGLSAERLSLGCLQSLALLPKSRRRRQLPCIPLDTCPSSSSPDSSLLFTESNIYRSSSTLSFTCSFQNPSEQFSQGALGPFFPLSL